MVRNLKWSIRFWKNENNMKFVVHGHGSPVSQIGKIDVRCCIGGLTGQRPMTEQMIRSWIWICPNKSVCAPAHCVIRDSDDDDGYIHLILVHMETRRRNFELERNNGQNNAITKWVMSNVVHTAYCQTNYYASYCRITNLWISKWMLTVLTTRGEKIG